MLMSLTLHCFYSFIQESAPRTITQFQYVAWPDHSCPSEASSIMDMVEMLEQVQRKTGNGPITVHCRYESSVPPHPYM